ncbi:hypothetical protein NLX67_03135 [Domibacillus sp. A3M-37]|uniref:hypothetical protein n=1 Tax=Domibacillus sp. A3M-37 TaxID=2962037 RepID=UPI0020B75815|nr:hypothetical protein [Domibacillus sp. A3M-37]MCP3761384.1 hypothetical protein [Domibacillus sp. A3M-37]
MSPAKEIPSFVLTPKVKNQKPAITTLYLINIGHVSFTVINGGTQLCGGVPGNGALRRLSSSVWCEGGLNAQVY